MGYRMDQRDQDFRIKEENFKPALEAVKALHKDETLYGWVSSKNVLSAKTLQRALREWRWDTHILEGLEGHGIEGIYFLGQNIGDEETLFEGLAPFVEDGSYIELEGEEGEIWRWTFHGGKLETKEAKISCG